MRKGGYILLWRKNNDLHIISYHLDCVALERAPAKWVCEACDVSGTAASAHALTEMT